MRISLMEKNPSFQLLTFLFVLLHVLTTCLAMNIRTDQTSLLALKSQITSDPYQILSTNWSSSASVCNWIGVTCGSRHQRVTVLNISDMGFSGTIPSQLGNLSFLVSLDLSYNYFHGEFPPEFSRLRKLRAINLSFNNFTGKIPIFLGEFQDLQIFNIENNSFSGFIPSSISNIKNLGFLNLRYNNLEGNIPTGIATLRSLKWLSFGFNKLNGSNVLSAFNISTLEYLDLRNAGLTGDFPSDLCGRLPRLQKLGLNFNMLSGEIPRRISECSQLQVLLLMENNLIGTIPGELGNLQLLQQLALGNNKLGGTIPNEIGHLHNLKQLGLEQNALTGSIPLSIFNISSLQVLSMWDNKLEGTLPREVGNLTTVNVLDLGMNSLTGYMGKFQVVDLLLISLTSLSCRMKDCVMEGTFQTFDRECEILRNLRHRNLTKIISSCCNLDFKALVLEYMPNGSLDKLLYSQDCSLNIMQRLNIMVDVASALEYLHHGYSVPVIHCDLKPSNVLLDKDMVGHLTDFGIAKLLTKEESIAHTTTFATIGYIAPVIVLQMLLQETVWLSKNDYGGELPSEFSHLRRLRVINLSYTNFTGEIPIGIATLPSLIRFSMGYNKLLNGSNVLSKFNISTLEYLDLRNSGLTGDFPSDLCRRLPRLKKLALGNNMLSGEVPRNISECSEIQLLMLFQNNFVGTIPREIGNLQLLQHLDLADNTLKGTIPDEIGHLYNLKNIFMDKNYLTGSIPLTLFNISSLEMLYMNDNKLEGPLPRQVGNLTMLAWFDLSNNYLADILKMNLSFNSVNGSLPLEVGNLKAALLLDLSRNQISGNIPSTLGGLQKLIQLSLAHNGIEGSIPETFGELQSLETLDLSYNKMSGVIPKSLEALKQLNSFNVSFNRLHGEIPSGGPFLNLPYQSFMLNKGLCGNPQKHVPACPSYSKNQSKSKKRSLIWIIVASSVVSMEGTFQTFDRECEMLRNLRHRNLTKIISSCCNLDFKALILEYMPNESLEKLLYSRDYCLNMMQRLNIMVDVASALEYLHHGYSVPVIHCDLKPSNVLLDNDMMGHLTDFGIAKLLTKEESIAQTTTFATIGYIAPGECCI
ncbi:hypothetical protein RDI58_005054 [Solanum bulbocastanum]|uniref:non-specific serine/threonine protein kinase n=1 Tax=Solanum bulbocastanum TaxID=147425 RepID=A0AAN8YM70_SOLBU